jgi:hypothetical protein
MRDRKPGNIAVLIRLQGTEESFQNPAEKAAAEAVGKFQSFKVSRSQSFENQP